MFSTSNLNRWALSISTVALTVAGTFVSVDSSVDAQTAACQSGDLTGLPVAQAPARERTAAQNAANAYANPDVPLRRFERQTSSTGVRTVEIVGERTNGCNLEVDVISGTGNIEEIEEQLQSLSLVPAAVRTRLTRELPRFRATFIEKSTRPAPRPRPVPPLAPNTVVYEIEGICTGVNPIPGPTPGNYCVNGQAGEAQINSDGTNFVFIPST